MTFPGNELPGCVQPCLRRWESLLRPGCPRWNGGLYSFAPKGLKRRIRLAACGANAKHVPKPVATQLPPSCSPEASGGGSGWRAAREPSSSSSSSSSNHSAAPCGGSAVSGDLFPRAEARGYITAALRAQAQLAKPPLRAPEASPKRIRCVHAKHVPFFRHRTSFAWHGQSEAGASD